jgi:hypothetical protein
LQSQTCCKRSRADSGITLVQEFVNDRLDWLDTEIKEKMVAVEKHDLDRKQHHRNRLQISSLISNAQQQGLQVRRHWSMQNCCR